MAEHRESCRDFKQDEKVRRDSLTKTVRSSPALQGYYSVMRQQQ